VKYTLLGFVVEGNLKAVTASTSIVGPETFIGSNRVEEEY
jgi:hypothetical protein